MIIIFYSEQISSSVRSQLRAFHLFSESRRFAFRPHKLVTIVPLNVKRTGYRKTNHPTAKTKQKVESTIFLVCTFSSYEQLFAANQDISSYFILRL